MNTKKDNNLSEMERMLTAYGCRLRRTASLRFLHKCQRAALRAAGIPVELAASVRTSRRPAKRAKPKAR
jgi:hypothetical protein